MPRMKLILPLKPETINALLVLVRDRTMPPSVRDSCAIVLLESDTFDHLRLSKRQRRGRK